MELDRTAGILLHITSLPGPFGVGDLGEGVDQFLQFMEQAGQSVWQILPLSPPLYGNSPYSSSSAFAGNPLLISPRGLHRDGWLSHSALRSIQTAAAADSRCDYGAAYRAKTVLLNRAFLDFRRQGGSQSDAYRAFCCRAAYWLDDFALFIALGEKFGTTDWSTWPKELAQRQPSALEAARQELEEAIAYHKFVQFAFDSQWREVWQQARSRGIRLFGDQPIFVAYGSADVWAHQRLFLLDEAGKPTVVAGVPPDYFSSTGQLWGNPLYNWEVMRAERYQWWVERLKWAFAWHDAIRIDHFRGFEAYWEVPAGSKTAVNGRWVAGPGRELFDVARESIDPLNVVAEDLGLITPEVHALRDALGLPGMRVMQFGFDSDEDTYHRPDAYPQHCVAYTGTHDNNTMLGWYAHCSAATRQRVEAFLRQQPQELPLHLQFCNMLYESRAGWTIVPLQDLLGLGDEARMNVPGKADGNWAWRCRPDQLSESLAGQVRHLIESHDRTIAAPVGAGD
ncbi:MAG: 4-alpha-glucanotransferase [Pirellulaceae bacterium]|nr:MAG: 4-alpha-glucanotransferase [Pirellulaceae bacterium]